MTRLEPQFLSFSSNAMVEILAIDLPGQVLKWLSVHILLSSDGRLSFEEWAHLCDRYVLTFDIAQKLMHVIVVLTFIHIMVDFQNTGKL